MSEMNHIITLVLGDWSDDGHGKTETINIKSNLNKGDMEKAYKAGSKKLGFDFCSDVAAEYEENDVDDSKWAKLKELGYKDKALEDEAEKYNEGKISLWTDSYTDIYLFIIKLGNEDFQYKYLTGDLNPQIRIGGYGLFH